MTHIINSDARFVIHDRLVKVRLKERFSRPRIDAVQSELDSLKVSIGAIEERLALIGDISACAHNHPIIKTFSSEIESLQRHLRTEQARAAKLTNQVDQLHRTLGTDVSGLLRHIKSLPYVRSVGIHYQFSASTVPVLLRTSTAVLINAVYAHQGSHGSELYDFGDWLLLFPHYWMPKALSFESGLYSERFFTSQEVRSGLRSTWKRSATAYPYYGNMPYDSFCFGERNLSRLNKLAENGYLYQAVMVAHQLITDVNVNDKSKVPSAFKRAGLVSS